jgi:hypothetical protein
MVRTELEAKRALLIETGTRLGLAHPETLKLSQEVDDLHNEYVYNERNTIK